MNYQIHTSNDEQSNIHILEMKLLDEVDALGLRVLSKVIVLLPENIIRCNPAKRSLIEDQGEKKTNLFLFTHVYASEDSFRGVVKTKFFKILNKFSNCSQDIAVSSCRPAHNQPGNRYTLLTAATHVEDLYLFLKSWST